jgi:hypothetical protein
MAPECAPHVSSVQNVLVRLQRRAGHLATELAGPARLVADRSNEKDRFGASSSAGGEGGFEPTIPWRGRRF